MNEPVGVMWPMKLLPVSVNQRPPSGPVMIRAGWVPATGSGNSVITPAVVIRPILLADCSVNHKFPSNPAVIPSAPPKALGTGNSVIT